MKTISEDRLCEVFPEIQLISRADWREKCIKIWKEAFEESEWDTIENAVFDVELGHRVSLVGHTRSVTNRALSEMKVSQAFYRVDVDQDKLLVMCILHDVSKILENAPKGDAEATKSPIGRKYMHGFLSAYYAQREGFPIDVVAAISNHSGASKKAPEGIEASIMYFADIADADFHGIMAGRPTLIQKFKGR